MLLRIFALYEHNKKGMFNIWLGSDVMLNLRISSIYHTSHPHSQWVIRHVLRGWSTYLILSEVNFAVRPSLNTVLHCTTNLSQIICHAELGIDLCRCDIGDVSCSKCWPPPAKSLARLHSLYSQRKVHVRSDCLVGIRSIVFWPYCWHFFHGNAVYWISHWLVSKRRQPIERTQTSMFSFSFIFGYDGVEVARESPKHTWPIHFILVLRHGVFLAIAVCFRLPWEYIFRLVSQLMQLDLLLSE